jgi:nucleotide-binding universal stress UspA family protein
LRAVAARHGKVTINVKKILWATDFSTHARDAGRKALECARCTDSPIDVVTVVAPNDLPTILLDVPDPFIAEEAVHEAERRLQVEHEDRVRQEFLAETAFLTEAGVAVELHVRVGSPAEQIVSLASELGTELIVIGSHGKRSVEELLLGSTVDDVTKRATCPVMVVR